MLALKLVFKTLWMVENIQEMKKSTKAQNCGYSICMKLHNLATVVKKATVKSYP